MKKWYESAFCNRLAGWIAGALLFCVLFGMLTVIAWNGCFVPAYQYVISADWESVPCVITKSTAEKHWSRAIGTHWEPKIEFQYSFGGRHYVSSSFTISSSSHRYELRGKTAVRDYPVGKQTTCLVNPENPSEAILLREYLGMIPGCLTMALLLICTLVGAIAIPIFRHRKQTNVIHFSTGWLYYLAAPFLFWGGIICWYFVEMLPYGSFYLVLALAFFGVLTIWGAFEFSRYFIRTWKVFPPVLTLTVPPCWGGMLEFDWEVPPASKLESFELKLTATKSKSTTNGSRYASLQTDTIFIRHLQRWSAGRKRNKPRTGHVCTPLPNSEMELTLDSSAHCVLRLELTGKTFRGKTCEWEYTLTISTPEAKQ